jgi:hypothetical protein
MLSKTKDKMAKNIQRQRKATKRSQTVNSDVNTNLGTNQNVVKVVIQHPEPPKPRRKSARKPKVDEKKEEAVDDLREALSEYDKAQNEAGERGVKIPEILGVSPSEASEIKNTDDILRFIQLVRQKTQQIRDLKPVPKAVEPPPRSNPFLTPIVPSAPTIFPQSPFALRPGVAPPVPFPGPGRVLPGPPRAVPQVPQSEIDKDLADIADSLEQATTPEELAFEDVVTQTNAGVMTIRDDIQKTYTSQKNQLADAQVKNYKIRYENRRKRLEEAYAKLPADSQAKLSEAKSTLEMLINDLEERLGEIERASQAALPAPDDPDDPVPEDPGIPEVDAEFEADVQFRSNPST